MLPLRDYFDLSFQQEEVVVSSTVLSAFFASLAGGPINTKLGRRLTIIIAAGIFTFLGLNGKCISAGGHHHTLLSVLV